MPTQQRSVLWSPPPFVPGRFQAVDDGGSGAPSDALADAAQSASQVELPKKETGRSALESAERSLWSQGVQETLKAQNIAPLSSMRGVWLFKDAFKKYFGDDAEIEYDGERITVKTPKGAYVFGIAFGQTKKGEKRASLIYYKDGKQPVVIGRIFPYKNQFAMYSKDFSKIGYKRHEVVKTENPPKQKPKWRTAALVGGGILGTAATIHGASRLLGGGGGDDDDENKQGQLDVITLGQNEDKTENSGGTPAPVVNSGGPLLASGDGSGQQLMEPKTKEDTKENKRQAKEDTKENKPSQAIVREIMSGVAPVQVTRKDGETQIRAETSAGKYGLNIGTTDTLILKDDKAVGKVPTVDVIAAVEQLRAGKTEREIKKSGMFDELFKNPFFFVALALAFVAFTRRR